MGRKATHPNLPKGMLARKRYRKNGSTTTYYFYNSRQADGSRKEIALGKDYILAVQQWAKLEQSKINAHDRPTYNAIATRYKAEMLSKNLAASTIKNKTGHFMQLDKFFDGAPLDEITPQHIRQYLDWRRNTPASANNETSTFSDMWDYARELGYTDRANPVRGIKKFKISRRDNYIENKLYELVYSHAGQQLRDLMDIAYLTGQRPIDIVSLHSDNLKDGYLCLVQQKTKAKLSFEITGDLKKILDRIKPKEYGYFFYNQHKRPMTRDNLTKAFFKLRQILSIKYPEYRGLLENFQFRDLRAKSATDIYLNSSLSEAKNQLGHASEQMTKTYIRKAKPLSPIKQSPIKMTENENDG